jgi:prephenate dehydrogenase
MRWPVRSLADSGLAIPSVTTGAPRIETLAVVGVGLIGGSFALALKEARHVGSVVGVGRGRENLDAALASGIVDRAVTLREPWTREIESADLVLVATPVGEFAALFAALAPHLRADAIVTDAGSTKESVIAAARAHLGSAFSRFVPGHPIAGTEHSGASAAFATLFRDRNVVLTPTAETDAAALATVTDLWSACGAHVRQLDPAAHDRIFAAVSHLPHLLAFALVDLLAARPDADDVFRFAASGFRDFTRIAASSPEMWRDISLANRDALVGAIEAYRTQLAAVAAMVASADGASLEAVYARAAAARRAWGAAHRAAAAVPADGSRER